MLLSMPLSAASADLANDYTGIWQSVDYGNYYVIHDEGDRLVFIDLAGIERSGDTIQFTYMGKKTDLIMHRVAPKVPAKDILDDLQLQFESSDEGIMYPFCEFCLNVVMFKIRKVF
jgi:hypothetical protein